jgi:hypothetical protein
MIPPIATGGKPLAIVLNHIVTAVGRGCGTIYSFLSFNIRTFRVSP